MRLQPTITLCAVHMQLRKPLTVLHQTYVQNLRHYTLSDKPHLTEIQC